MRKIKIIGIFLFLIVTGIAVGTVLGITIGNGLDIGIMRAAVSNNRSTHYIDGNCYIYVNLEYMPKSSGANPSADSRGTMAFDPSNPPATYMLDEIFEFFDGTLAVYFKNLTTGFTYTYNPDGVFFGASLSKIKHAMYVYTLAERGLVNMYTVHTFTAADFWGGTGILRFEPAGTRLTTRELLGHSIIYSCNVAFRMLVRYTANKSFSFHDFTIEINANADLIGNVIAQDTSARDMSLWMYAIFNYLESDSRYGHYFMYDLLNTAPTSHHYFTRWQGSFGTGGEIDVRLLHSDYPMARKYGWSPFAFHEAAIVYGPSPFLLVVLSDMDRGAHNLFEDISWLMQEFNDEWFQGEYQRGRYGGPFDVYQPTHIRKATGLRGY